MTGPATPPRGGRPGARRAGLTLIEVLVACAILALLASSAVALVTAGLRLQTLAARRAARTEALTPWTVPGSRPATRLPACDAVAPADGEPAACLRTRLRCRLDASVVRCDGAGAGGLWRLDLDVVGADGRPIVPGVAPLRVWTEAP